MFFLDRRQLIVSFGRRVINHSKGLWEYIPKSIPSGALSVHLSVCTTIFKRIDGLNFYPKSLMLYINRFVWTSSSNKWKAFLSNFESVFEILAENRKFCSKLKPFHNLPNTLLVCWTVLSGSRSFWSRSFGSGTLRSRSFGSGTLRSRSFWSWSFGSGSFRSFDLEDII